MLTMRIACLSAVLAVMASEAASAAVTFLDTQAAFEAASNATLIETFDGFAPTDVTIPGPIVRGNVTYSPIASFPVSPNLVVTNPATVYSNFGTNLNPVNASVLTASGNEDILVEFASSQSAVGFEGYLNGLGNATVQVFNGESLLDTLVLPNAAGGALVYIGIVSDAGFTAFRWTAVGGETLNTAIDSISAQPVPLPSALLLFAAGLPLLGRRIAGRGQPRQI